MGRLRDHPASHVVQNAALLLPFTRRAQMRRATTGAMNEPELVTRWARNVLAATRAAGIDPAATRFVEIGPGHSLGVALCLLLDGCAAVTAIDVAPFADPQDLASLRPVAERWAVRADLSDAMRRLDYEVVADGGWPLPPTSVGVVYSFYSGEHLRAPEQVLAETRRVLRDGGLCVHAIDLRDHYNFEGNWLKFLEYPPRLWEAMTSRRGRWTNRLRAPQWKRLFEDGGFEILTFEEDRWPLPRGFDHGKLTGPYRDMTADELSVGELWVVARKRS